jgi:riboflavin synthase
MFTGIIEETGEVVDINDTGDFRTIRVRGRAVFDDLRLGSSIAVNGVCLTSRSVEADTFSAEMSHETLARTSLGNLARGAIVNLERPMRGDSRFGGHIVQGHVDGVGRFWPSTVQLMRGTSKSNIQHRAGVTSLKKGQLRWTGLA